MGVRKHAVVGMMICMLMLAGCGQTGLEADTATQQSVDTEQTAAVETSSEQVNTESEGIAAETPAENTESTAQEEPADATSDMLVIYFSRTGEQYNVGVIDKGNTAIVADMIVEQTGADVFEILPRDDYYPYTYDELTDIAKKEQNENARPVYAGDIPDLSQYSTIFIGERAIIGTSQGKAA